MELKKYKLGEIGEIRMCKRILKSETNPYFGIPFYKIGTFGKIADAFIDPLLYKHYKKSYSFPRKGDVLISAAGTIGKSVIYNGEDAYFQDSNIVWIEHDQSIVLNEFLYYLLNSIQWIPSKGSTIFRLYNDDIRNKEVFIPSIKEQRGIVSVLSSIDRKIELNRTINQNLEAMAKQLYDYWFVQFDFPNEEGKPYKSSGGEMVWNEKIKREIPIGWDNCTLKDFLTIKNGRDHKYLSEGLYPVYGSGGEMRRVNEYLYKGESVLMPRKGTLNNIMYVDESFWTVDTMFYSEMKVLNCAKYIFFAIKDIDFTRWDSGTGVPSMTVSTLYNLPMIKPNIDLLKRFDKAITPIFYKMKQIRVEYEVLTKQRDELLPLLMNGQITIE
ncbi:MAG: restriction endonuclease subunit S [Candidatus Onthomorpha sp.]|nr:restriction endonuclease subunit S [Candidatus Onthomorpha sp.]